MSTMMEPKDNEDTISIPVTFDYNGGRADSKRSKILLAIILTVVSIIFIVGITKSPEKTFINKIILDLIIIAAVTTFLRFATFNERLYSNIYEKLKKNNFSLKTTAFWGIYEVDLNYPYICHFKDGKIGIFVKLEKDVIIGKPRDILYRHCDAIAEAYNSSWSSNLNICHIDCMDNVGNDPRLQNLYENLANCSNTDLKEIMLDIYSNLQEVMSENYASFDTYVFTTRGSEEQFWGNIQDILGKFMEGNYISYKILNMDDLRSLCKTLLNFNDFSALEACNNIFTGQNFRGIVPISVEHLDGTIDKVGKTQEEIRLENEAKLKEELEQRELKKKKGKNKSNIGTVVVDDLILDIAEDKKEIKSNKILETTSTNKDISKEECNLTSEGGSSSSTDNTVKDLDSDNLDLFS